MLMIHSRRELQRRACALAALLVTAATWNVSQATPVDAARRAVFEQYLRLDLLLPAATSRGWTPDGSGFWYAEGSPADVSISRIDLSSNSKTPLFDVPRVRAAMAKELNYEPPGRGLPFSQFAFTGPGAIQFSFSGAEYSLDLQSHAIQRLPSPAPSMGPWMVGERDRVTPRLFRKESFLLVGEMDFPESLSPDGRWFASVQGNNLSLRSTYDGREFPLTDDGEPTLRWDVETVKWRPWSPDGAYLAAFQIDSARVETVPQIHWLQPQTQIVQVPNTRAGGFLPKYQLYIIDVQSHARLKIDLGDVSDQYVTVLDWTPGGAELLVARWARDFHKVDILAANPRTGATRTVLSETSPTFVRLQHEVLYSGKSGFTLLPGGKRFIWESTRSGWNHLYLYDLDGKLIRQLTNGEFPVLDVQTVDAQAGWVYFTAHAEKRLYDTHLYRVDLDGRGFRKLTQGDGQHTAAFSPSKQFFIDTYSSVDRPPATQLRAADGQFVRDIGTTDMGRLLQVGWTPPEEFVVKAADGKTDLYGVLYKPYDFDPSQKYPVVEYIYGGPQTTVTHRDFSAWNRKFSNLPRALAQLGYVTVMLDARGTPERSKAFQDVVYKNWGRNEIPDHAAALRQLAATHKYVDLERVGIFGASWGGYFTVRALTQAPDIYKAGIAMVSGFDPYASILYEPYLGLPVTDRAAYDYAFPFSSADKLQGSLMLVGNTADHGTFGDTIRMIEALVRAGKQHEVMLLPNQPHGALGKSEDYLIEGIVNFFATHLQVSPQ